MATIGEIFNRYVSTPAMKAGKTIKESLEQFHQEYPSLHEKSSYLAEALTPYAVPKPLRKDLPLLVGMARQELAKKVHPEDYNNYKQRILNINAPEEIMKYIPGEAVSEPVNSLSYTKKGGRYLSEGRSKQLEQEMREKLFERVGIKPLAKEYFKTIPVLYRPKETHTYGGEALSIPKKITTHEVDINSQRVDLERLQDKEQEFLDLAKKEKDPTTKKQHLDTSRAYAKLAQENIEQIEEYPVYRPYAEALLNPTIVGTSEIVQTPSISSSYPQLNESDQLRILLHEYIHTMPRTIYPFEASQREREKQFKNDFREAFEKTKSLREIGLVKRGFHKDTNAQRLEPVMFPKEYKPSKEQPVSGIGGTLTLEDVFRNEEEMFADIGSMLGPDAINLPIIGKYYEPIFERGKGKEMDWMGNRILKERRKGIQAYKSMKEMGIDPYTMSGDEGVIKAAKLYYELGRPYEDIIEEKRKKTPGMKTVGEMLEADKANQAEEEKRRQTEAFNEQMRRSGMFVP